MALSLASCSDFLNPEPEHRFNADKVLSDESELEYYARGLINENLPTITSVAFNIQRINNVASWGGDEHSDLGFVKNKWNVLDPTMFGTRQQGGWGSGNWSTLRACNYYINKMVRAKDNVEPKVYRHYQGVGRFWRAWFYYDMVQEFENVPWYDQEIAPDDEAMLYKTQDSREFVMEKVLEDISFAADSCATDAKYVTSRTTINRYTALALKARICLYEGTYRKYHTELGLNDSERWLQLAADAAKALMDSKKFSLVSDYKSLFQTSSLENSEVILGVAYDATLRKHDTTWQIFSPTAGSCWSMTHPFICTYLMTDGSRYTDKAGYATKQFADVFTGRDKRLAATVLGPEYEKKVNGVMTQISPLLNITLSGYQMIKWALPEGGSFDSQAISYNSAPIFRYGEVLLTYAEAMAELGKMDQTVWNATIGLLRTRAGVATTMPANADPYMQNYFLNRCTDKYVLEVRRERGCELAWEGLRYQDILRWKCGELLAPAGGWAGIYIPKLGTQYDLNGDGTKDICVYSGTKPSGPKTCTFIKVSNSIKLSNGTSGYLMYGVDYNLKWNDYMYVRPIPETAIQINPNLVQREGWQSI